MRRGKLCCCAAAGVVVCSHSSSVGLFLSLLLFGRLRENDHHNQLTTRTSTAQTANCNAAIEIKLSPLAATVAAEYRTANVKRPVHHSQRFATMFTSVVPVGSDEEEEAAMREQEEAEEEEEKEDEDMQETEAELGMDDDYNTADEQPPPLEADTERQATSTLSPSSSASSKKRPRDTHVTFAVPLAPVIPPLPASAPQPPQQSSSATSSSSSSSSRRPRLPPRPSRPTSSSSSLAASDRAEMDESLSTMLQPPASRVKKRGRPLGSTSDRLPAELQRRMGEANSLFVQQEYEACEQLLKSIIHQSRLSLAPYHTLALVYEAQNDTLRLCDTQQVIAELSPRDAENWKSMARTARQLDDLPLAEKAVGRAVALSGGLGDEGVAWVKGWVEAGKKEWKKAAATWSWLLDRQRFRDGDPAIREMLVRSLRATGHIDRAIAVIEEYMQKQQEIADKAAGTQPHTDDEQRSRAREQRRTEQRQQREQRQHDMLFSADVGYDSDTDSAFLDSDSEDDGGGSAAHSPLNLELVTAVCWMYCGQHMYHKVNDLMATVALLLPAGTSLSLELRCLHAVCLLHLGYTQRAVIQLNRLLDVNFNDHPNFLPLLLLTANAYHQTSMPQSALAAYRVLLPHAPYTDDPAVWLQMAACLRSMGTTEEEWEEAKELYQRVLGRDEGNAEARIGLAALERESGEDEQEQRQEEEEEEEEKEEKAAAAVREKRPKRARPVPAELAVERPLPQLPEQDITITHLLQTTTQLTSMEEQAKTFYDRKDYASLITEVLPILQRTVQVASGNNPQPAPAPIPAHLPAMPSLEDENGQPAMLPRVQFAAPVPEDQLTRKHRVAASRLLLSRAAFQTASYVVTALSSTSSASSAPSASAAARSANVETAVQLVGDLSTHFLLKRTYSILDADCPRLLFGTLYKQCIPLLLAMDQTQQAYSYCQQMFDKQNNAIAPAASSTAASTAAAADVAAGVEEDLDVAEVVGAVLRRAGYPRKVRRWLTTLRDKGSNGHDVTVRVLLAHSWYSHRGYHTAAVLYHQALALLHALPPHRHHSADYRRLVPALHLHLSLALLHRALSTSSRMKPTQRQQQTAQLLRSLAYVTAYRRSGVGGGAVGAWNVGRWYQAARWDGQAVRWYEKVLAMEEGEGEEAGGGVVGCGVMDVKKRAAECLALIYKRSGNELLAARLYAEYGGS